MAIGAEEATLKLSVETREAEAAVGRFNAKLGETATASTLTGAAMAAGLVAAATASLAVLSKLVAVADAVVSRLISMAEQGDKVSDVYHNLRISVQAAQEAAAHEVSQLDLGILANKAMVAELKLTSASFADIATFAKRAGDATGRDFGDVAETVIRALSTGRTRSLKEFGIFLKDGGDRAKLLADALVIMRRRSEEMGAGVETAGDAVARIKVRMSDFTDELVRAYTEDKHLVFAMGELDQAFASSGGAAAALGHAVANVAAVVAYQIAEVMKAWNRFAASPAGRAALSMIGIEQTDPWADRRAGMRLTGRPLDVGDSLGAGRLTIGAPEGPAAETEPGRGGGGARRDTRAADLAALHAAVEAQIEVVRQREADAATAFETLLGRDDRAQFAQLLTDLRGVNDEETRLLEASSQRNAIEKQLADEQRALYEDKLDAIQNYTAMAGQSLGGWFQRSASLEEAAIQRDANALLAKTTDSDQRVAIEEKTQAKLLKVRQAAEAKQLWITAAVEAVAAAVAFAMQLYPVGIQHTAAAALAAATAASLGSGALSTGSGRASGGHTAGSMRGGVGGAGGNGNVTNITVMLDAAGGVIQDSQLRRLGKYVSDAHSRGYINGRRAA